MKKKRYAEQRCCVVRGDNFDRAGTAPQFNEEIIVLDVSLYWGEQIARALNAKAGPNSSDYFYRAPIGYKPVIFAP